MKRPHLLQVMFAAPAYRELIELANEHDLRVGWLELESDPEPPVFLDAAAAEGVMRAVAVGGGRSVAVKPIRGPAVLDDLLREHFLGCALVLVRGGVATIDAPMLSREGDAEQVFWKVASGPAMTSAELVGRLRRPRPWSHDGED